MSRELLIELHRAQTRRRFLGQLGLSFSGLALHAMMAGDALAEAAWRPPSGLPMLPPKARRVIWLFMRGGVSHMESFDPKPALNAYAGKSIVETPFKDVLAPEKLKNVRQVAAGVDDKRLHNHVYPLGDCHERPISRTQPSSTDYHRPACFHQLGQVGAN